MKKTQRLKIEAGVRYGRFLVSIEEVPTGRGQHWSFRCDCGNEVVKRASWVISGEVVTCGYRCGLRHKLFIRTHGHTSSTLGRSRASSEYLSWRAVKARCGNPKQTNWLWYGGRGITVCERWRTLFANFLADMGAKPTPKHGLKLIDPDGSYEPGNCRWATREEIQKKTNPQQRLARSGRPAFRSSDYPLP